MELTPGTPIEDTWAQAELVRERISDIPEITSIFTTIGASSGGGMSSRGGQYSVGALRKASLTVNLQPANSRMRSQSMIEDEIRTRLKAVPGTRFSVGFGMTGEKLQLNLTSEDPILLNRSAETVMRELRNIPGLGNITSNASLLRPEVFISHAA